ncbi:hypothetical protein MAPG_08893 [Magnaporthiopsis poae ATCC 64411]|uniref:Uncharacterized protein n=1 Tax=Magnaporthiopsis poae (strain ATCC 64411 / 73-15) TaxID=644358 RepID=A0A0C4E8I4_MAGP6|nr:hypothetical protein MAPG_08893 [Magnaporthiopsis poae ATCC 64411]
MHAKFLLPFLIAGALAAPPNKSNVGAKSQADLAKAHKDAYPQVSTHYLKQNNFRDKNGNPSVRKNPAKPPPRSKTPPKGNPIGHWPKGKPLHKRRNIGNDKRYQSAGEEAFLAARGEHVNKDEDGAEVKEADE